MSDAIINEISIDLKELEAAVATLKAGQCIELGIIPAGALITTAPIALGGRMIIRYQMPSAVACTMSVGTTKKDE